MSVVAPLGELRSMLKQFIRCFSKHSNGLVNDLLVASCQLCQEIYHSPYMRKMAVLAPVSLSGVFGKGQLMFATGHTAVCAKK